MFKKTIIGKWDQAIVCRECGDSFYARWKDYPFVSKSETPNPLICKNCGSRSWKDGIGRKIITYKDWIFFTTNKTVYWEVRDV